MKNLRHPSLHTNVTGGWTGGGNFGNEYEEVTKILTLK